jgi:hypothetical protein
MVRILFPPAESPSLSRIRFRRSRTPAFRASVRGWLGDWVGRDAQGFPFRANRWQYLYRAIFQYRSAVDLGGDCSGNGISELIITVLAAVAQFERSLISERIKDAKRNLRRGNKHQGGKRPFGWQIGEANGHGRARELVPDEAEQAAIADIVAMREGGRTLMDIRDTLRGQGFAISHQSVANILARRAVAA